MAKKYKIDSNVTGLSFAEETSIGVLPADPNDIEWNGLEPNSYPDFGGELTLLARNPINAGRQRKKGAITDLNASGGFNQDLTQTNLQKILQGFMFASFREKTTQAVSAVIADTMTVADGTAYAVGDIVFGKGFGNAANNSRFVVSAVAANDLTLVGAVAEAPPAGATLAIVGIQSAAADMTVDTTGTLPKIASAAIDFTTLGLIPGEWIYVGGDFADEKFPTPENNGFKRVRSIAVGALTLDKSDAPMVAEVTTTQAVELYFGRVLKNEVGQLIKRRSYHIERQLGAPDDASPNVQSEYLKGSVPSELTINVGQADKINCDMTFVAIDNEQRTAAEGLMPGARPPLVEADMFNTSSDFSGLRLAIHSDTDEAVTPLFAFAQELTLAVNNNLSANKAVAVLGAFDVTAGTFMVSGSLTAYFSDVEAVRAVRNNADVSLYAMLAKQNAGLVFDVPLVALGNGRLNVTQDQPITLPLTMDAATAAKIDANLDYTLLFVFFDYLPTVAEA